jgi:ABC-type Fe3+/spermidine/putrescine transport system ATPase subunit
MVFQSYAIWPHMTVGENVAYPLEGTGLGRAERHMRMRRALDLVGLAALVDRPAPNLSGGQQQRVALARALVAEPQILLLDEPLSNLDAKLRDQMRREIKRLQRRLGLTALFVTHDQEEALALSDTIALMNNGEVVEMGLPQQLYDLPERKFTAGFLGLANFLPGDIVQENGGDVVLQTPFGRFSARRRSTASPSMELFFRPHKASVTSAGRAGSLDVGVGTVVETIFLGETNDVLVEKDGRRVRLRLHGHLPQEGETLTFALDPTFNLAFGTSPTE